MIDKPVVTRARRLLDLLRIERTGQLLPVG